MKRGFPCVQRIRPRRQFCPSFGNLSSVDNLETRLLTAPIFSRLNPFNGLIRVEYFASAIGNEPPPTLVTDPNITLGSLFITQEIQQTVISSCS
jgi:hypothetical protein